MTQEERKKFDAFQRQLNESPANRISFFAGMDEERAIANTPYEQWALQSEYENKAICKHLGIEYRKEDFAVSAEGLAKQWAGGLPDMYAMKSGIDTLNTKGITLKR